MVKSTSTREQADNENGHACGLSVVLIALKIYKAFVRIMCYAVDKSSR